MSFQELVLPESATNLYTMIRNFSNNPPDALMVLGLESLLDLERLLAATNNVRDSFRSFSFPIVIWGSDSVFKQLRKVAADFNSFASAPIPFSLADEELERLIFRQIDGAVNDADNFQVKPGEIEALRRDLESRESVLDEEARAGFAFLLGWDLARNDRIDAAVEKYRECLQFWWQSENFEKQGLVLLNLGWLWQKQGEDSWQQARDYLQESLDSFEWANRGDLVAKYIGYLGEVFRRLNQWDELKVLAQKALSLHEGRGEMRQVARDYGWLAEVALQESEWREAGELAGKALAISEPEITVKERALFGFIFGKSQAGLRLMERAIISLVAASDNLETARQKNSAEYDAKLHVEILKKLRDWQSGEKQYLQAFRNKQLQRQIESQYGWRAFVGAARLQPPAIDLAGKTAEEKMELLGQIAAFSGRQADLERLVARIKNPKHKLTVIYGQSGVGKSSILQAGLIPALQLTYFEGRDYVPVAVRVYQDWARSLGQQLVGIFNIDSVNFSREWILSQLRENEHRDMLTVLMFDQFEEFFFDNPDAESRTKLYRFLEECLNIPYLKLILSLREDYIYYLLEFDRQAKLNIDKNYEDILYYLGNFSREEAKEAIVSLTERSQITLESDLVEVLVEDLARQFDGVRPIEFQVVGMQLETEEIMTLERYRQLGEEPKEVLVERFLEEAVKDCGEENQVAAKLVLLLLTNTENTRPLKTKGQLKEYLEIEEEKLDLVLEVLVGSALVLLVPEMQENFYQLLHDYLVSFVRRKYEQYYKLEFVVLQLTTKTQLHQELIRERQELIKETSIALASVAQNLILSNQSFEARLKAIKAGKKLFDNNFLPTNHISAVTDSLRLVAYKKEGELFRESNRLAGHESLVYSVSFSPDGSLIATASFDKTVKLWSRQGKLLKTLSGHKAPVYGVSFSPDGKLIASASDDKMVKLWSCQGKLLKTLSGHQAEVTGVSFSHDGKLIASASDDTTVKLWSRQGKLLKTLSGHEAQVYGVSFSPDGELIATASNDNTVKLWSRNGELVRTLEGHKSSVLDVNFSPDGELIASASNDKTVKLWSRNGELLQTLKRHEYLIYSVSFSPDGKLIASASIDKTVRLWSSQGKELQTLREHENHVYGVSFSPDGKLIASASNDNTVKLWSCQGKQLQRLTGHEDIVNGVSFSPDGELIASASEDKTVKLWNREGKELQTLTGHEDIVNGASFSPDGELIASASEDKTVKLWNREGKELQTLTGHEDIVNGVSFSLDGELIASASNDNTVKLWNREGKELQTLTGHEDIVNGVSFSPDGKLIASASNDNTVKLWNREGKELQTLTGA